MHSSYVQSGTLTEASHLPAYCVTEQLNTVSAPPVTRTTASLLTGLRQHSQQPIAGNITIAVCAASLAGSWEDDDNVTDTVELSSDIDVDKFVVDHLLAAAQRIVNCGAGVLACQKVNKIFVFFLFIAVSGF